MDTKEILKNFDKFNIPKDQIPEYKNADQFASQFKRCSILEYGNISYSNTSSPLPRNPKLKNKF